MGKINTSIDSNNLSNFSFYIDLERSTNSTLPFYISTSVPDPIYARIKNTGAGTITISAVQIIFYYGNPGPGSDYTLTTISPNETKYFWVSSRYLPSDKVLWNTYTNIKIGGKTSIKKQNLGGGKISIKREYAFVATGTGLSPDINGLRFYDSGLVRGGRPIYYDETNTYKLSFPNSFPFYWVLELISGSPGGYVQNFQPSAPVAGTYAGAFGWSGTVTISSI